MCRAVFPPLPGSHWKLWLSSWRTAAFAFAANEVSPQGLKLARNYFPGGTSQTIAPLQTPRPQAAAASTIQANQEAPLDDVDQRLKAKGLQPVSRAKTVQLFHDPRFQEGLIVFINARNQDEYNDGHIPGAYQLDPYHPEQQLPAVLTTCQAADQVVVYCTGGDCEGCRFDGTAAPRCRSTQPEIVRLWRRL